MLNLKSKLVARPISSKPARYCRVVARHMEAIRLQLKKLRAERGLRGSTRSALYLARLIGNLSRRGQIVGASEAVEIADYIETLLPILDAEIDQFLIVSGRQTPKRRLSNRCYQGVFPMPGNIGKTIRILRSAQGKTLKAVASESGLSLPFLSLVENGKRQPSLSVLRKIGKSLKVPAEVLLLLGMGSKSKLSSTDNKTNDITKSVLEMIEIETKLQAILNSQEESKDDSE